MERDGQPAGEQGSWFGQAGAGLQLLGKCSPLECGWRAGSQQLVVWACRAGYPLGHRRAMQGACRGNQEAWGTDFSVKRAPERLSSDQSCKVSSHPLLSMVHLTPSQESPLPLAASLQCPPLRKLNLVLTVKEKCFKESCPSSHSTRGGRRAQDTGHWHSQPHRL